MTGQANAESAPSGLWKTLCTAFVGSCVRPARAARRLNRWGLVQAFWVHVLSVLVGAAGVFVLAVWDDTIGTGRVLSSRLLREIEFVFEEVAGALSDPYSLTLGLLALVSFALMVELVCIVLSLLGMAWGARDERMSRSFGHALRRTWLQTPHLVVVVLLVGTWQTCWYSASRSWEQVWYLTHKYPHDLASLEKAPPPEGMEVDGIVYYAGPGDWMVARDRESPLWLKLWPILVAAAYAGLSIWWLLAWLAAVGADREVEVPDRGPMCDACGYSLVGAASDGRCPECGLTVAASCGAQVRPGAPWCQRHEVGRWAAWYRTAREVVCTPTAFGRRLPLAGRARDHWSFFLLHIPAAAVIGGVSIATAIIIDEPFRTASRDWQRVLAAVIGGSGLGVWLFVLLTLVAAWLAAWRWCFGAKRNLLTISVQMAAYAAPCVLFGLLVAGGMFAFGFALDHWGVYHRLRRVTGVDVWVQWVVIWLIPTALAVLGLFALVGRGTKTGRFANI